MSYGKSERRRNVGFVGEMVLGISRLLSLCRTFHTHLLTSLLRARKLQTWQL
jgi:hypothetical protein